MDVSHLKNDWPGKSLASMLLVLIDGMTVKRELFYIRSG